MLPGTGPRGAFALRDRGLTERPLSEDPVTNTAPVGGRLFRHAERPADLAGFRRGLESRSASGWSVRCLPTVNSIREAGVRSNLTAF